MKRKIILFLVVCMLLQIGCVAEIKDKSEGEENPYLQVEGSDSQILERSEKLSDIVVELFGIDRATTIIFNDIAIVSIITSYDQKLTDDTRETIENVIKENDNFIKDVKIAEDEKTFNDIEIIIGELLKGKSYDNYVLDVNKILDRNFK